MRKTTVTYTIGEATASDAARVYWLIRSSFDESRMAASTLALGRSRRYIAEGCSDEKRSVLVATHDTRIVGGLIGSHDGQGQAFISWLAVGKSVQGAGIGRALIASFFQWASRAGCTRVLLDVFRDNAQGLSFYAHLGGQPVGSTVALAHRVDSVPGGQILDVSGWGKCLARYRCVGFGSFALDCGSGPVTFGLLGRQYFRTCDWALAGMPSVMHTLASLDRTRRLLYFGPLPTEHVKGWSRIWESRRLAFPLEQPPR
jgi:GNAT superfamily N-acetyltransferase